MSDDFRKQIYNTLNLKETDELIEIWQKNDRVEWEDITFEMIREILEKRLGELPVQDEPVLEHIENVPGDEFKDDASFETFMDIDNAPVFYKPKEVLWLEKWINRAAIASIVVSVSANLLYLPQTQRLILAYFFGNVEWNFAAWLIGFIVFASSVALQGIIIYLPLKAFGSILKILMEMEFNSRGLTQKTPTS